MSRDLWFIAGMTALCAVGVGVVGALVVNRVRRVSLVAAMVVTALVPVAVVALAIWVNVGAMFLSEHDAAVARLVLGLSSLPAVVLAVLLGRFVLADVRAVGAQARGLATEAGLPAASPVTAELAELSSELARTRVRPRGVAGAGAGPGVRSPAGRGLRHATTCGRRCPASARRSRG